MTIELRRPAMIHKSRAIAAAQEWKEHGEVMEACCGLDCFLQDDPLHGYESWLAQVNLNWSGLSPEADFWLSRTYFIMKEEEIIGMLGITLALNKALFNVGGHIGFGVQPSQRQQGFAKEALRLALQKCQQWEMDRVLVTCDANNIPAQKVIEAVGGAYEDTRHFGGAAYRRYWFELNMS